MGLFDLFRSEGLGRVPLYLYNTLGAVKQEFNAVKKDNLVRMYNCGPTVYGRQHIGNLSMFVFTDILRRTLQYNGFNVKQVINFTDFGHLTSDADEGEDKMTKGLKREGLALTMANMRSLGEKYSQLFLEDMRALNVEVDTVTFPRASDYIPAQIAMIRTLEEKGYAYRTKSGVMYDTSRFPSYGQLGNIDLSSLKEGARVKADPEKRSPTDFILWKSDKKLGWDSPWGKGFPGWHLECSAMIRSTLGEQIDIHTGGIEHVAIHHNNEIAQSEAATGKKPFSRFWLHRAHIQLAGGKIAKSKGNVVYLSDVIERGFHPLSLRYLFLGAHYRTPMNFTWESLAAAQTAYGKLLAYCKDKERATAPNNKWHTIFHQRFNDDIDTPGALATAWQMIKDNSLSKEEKIATLLDADCVLGLKLSDPDERAQELASKELRAELTLFDLPEAIRTFIAERETARKDKDWARADQLRTKILDCGYEIDDAHGSSRVFKL